MAKLFNWAKPILSSPIFIASEPTVSSGRPSSHPEEEGRQKTQIVATLWHLPCELPEITSPNELVALYAVRIFPPDFFVFFSPTAHQIGTDKSTSSTRITGDEMPSVDIKYPDFVAKTAPDICEKLTNFKVARNCHVNHNLSRSMITPCLM